MNNKIKILIIIILSFFVIGTTFCIFTSSVVKSGNLTTKALSTKFLNNTDFLNKIRQLDSSIISVDKTTDLNRVLVEPTNSFTSDNIFSTDDSNVVIYLWIDNGIINYYTVATSIDLNN